MSHKSIGLNDLREMFLAFFETKGHLRLPSFSLIPHNDQSLLLINSGMAPMKPYFTGEVEPPRRRVCTCQKCIRTGDIENIGKTARHGTYFEMLGNFSFGDYFKREALTWSWEFLTSEQWVGLEPERLYPSVYVDDDEAYKIWTEEIGVPAERVTRLGKEDNFWEHGSGPCGPCSEIYYDRGVEHGCGKPTCAPGCDCDRFMEVWNNVFSQFNNDGEGHYTDLVQKNIDTGMGLERLACVCQNVDSLFDVDTVMRITNRVSEITGAHYNESYEHDVSLRIITDHIRSATFMISDGVLPSNEGRGYVLRRLLRRAARHGRLLGVTDPFLCDIIETVIQENEGHYPELREKKAFIERVVRTEEEHFARTIDAGMRIFQELLQSHKDAGESTFSGEDAFRLYDTYGFPVDLTAEMAGEEQMQVDMEQFHALMEQQRERARKARGDLSDAWAGIDLGLDNTPTQFIGYTTLTGQAQILALVEEGETCGNLAAGRDGIVVLDKTPFYAEMGGQVADHGVLTVGDATFQVRDVQRDKGGKYLHYGHLDQGELQVGQSVNCAVDEKRRRAIMRAHSATHLLQSALQQLLGEHVHQAGSLVEPDHLRFDFTHFQALTDDQIWELNSHIAACVLDGLPVSTREMPIDEAKALGAMALFGEKYGDVVRVVSMGKESIELCGGTHVENTAFIGPFQIVSEGSVASGVRRIEAITGQSVFQRLQETQQMVQQAAAALKTTPHDLISRLEGLLGELKDVKQQADKLKDRLLSADAERFLVSARSVGPLHVLTVAREDLATADLRRMGDFLRDRDPQVVAVLAAVEGEKITFNAVCGKQAVAAGVRAGDIIRAVTAKCGGKGGGKPDSAMGGGNDPSALEDALAQVDDLVQAKLK